MTVVLFKKQQKWFHLPLVLAFGFIFSYTGIHQCYGKILALQSGLSPSETKLYKEVQEERKNIYMKATYQSILVVCAYIIFHFLFACPTSPYYFISNILFLFFGSTFLFYTLANKQNSMILNANLSNEETKRWYKVYQCMQDAFWKGFLTGILASSFILMILDSMSSEGQMVIAPLKKKRSLKKQKKNK